MVQPAYVIREETLLPKSKLTDLQVKGVGPESILTVCKACAEACFVPGRVSFVSRTSSRAAALRTADDGSAVQLDVSLPHRYLYVYSSSGLPGASWVPSVSLVVREALLVFSCLAA